MNRNGLLSVVVAALGLLVFGALGPARVACAEEGYGAEQARLDEEALAAEAERAWYFAIDATYNGKYIWRGQNLVDDHVFQPSVTVGYEGLSFNIWGNRDTTDVNNQGGNFTEIDYTVDYSWTWKGLDLSTGAIYYDFPHSSAPETVEVYGAVAVDTLLSPSFTLYWDVDEADGGYASFAIGHTFPDVWQPAENVSMSVDLSGSVGFASANWNNFYYGVDKSAFTDALVSLGLPVQFGERWSLTPAVNFSQLLDDDIRDTFSDQSNFWAGVTLSYSF